MKSIPSTSHKLSARRLSLLAALLAAGTATAAGTAYVSYVKPVYTVRLRDSHGGNAQLMSKLKVSIEMANEGLRNSQVDFSVQMAFPMMVNPVVENGLDGYGGTLESKIRYENAQGIWSTYLAQGADHLAYFDSGVDGAGVANINGEYSFNGGVGNTVFRHEIGHNWSLYHEDGMNNPYGATIMGGNGLPYYSNPALSYGGYPLGDAYHNSAAKITANRPTSAGRHKLTPNSDYYSTWYVTSKQSDKAIDVSGGSTAAGARIQQWGLNYTSAQSWHCNNFGSGASTFERWNNTGNNYFTFKTGTSGGLATQEAWLTGKMRYFMEEQADGYMRIRRDDGNMVVTLPQSWLGGAPYSDGTQLVQYPDYGDTPQRWKFIQAN